MQDIELQSRLEHLGMSRRKARTLTRKIRDELHPQAAIAATLLAQPQGMQGLAGNTGTAFSFASMGPKAGQAPIPIPLSGADIGAAIGAVAGLLIHTGQKPQRAADAAKVMADLAAFPASASGSQVTWDVFGHVWYALIINGGLYRWHPSNIMNHPSSMDQTYNDFVADLKSGIRQALAAGLSRAVTLTINNPSGKTYSVPVNVPPNLDESAWTVAVTIPIFINGCGAYNDRNQCTADVSRVPNMQKALQLMTGRVLADMVPAAVPNVSTQIAQTPLAMVPPGIVNNAQVLAQSVQRAGVAPSLVTPINYLQNTPAPGYNMIPYGAAQGFVPSQTTLSPSQDATAGILQSLLSMQGNQSANMVSMPAQSLLADVAAQGVQQTRQGPAPIPAWAIPAGIGAGILLLFAILRK